MKRVNLGLFYTFLGILCVSDGANAAIRVGNSSRSNAQAYQQVNEMRAATMNPAGQVTDPADLPINVTSEQTAQDIIAGTGDVSVADLESCSMIYPTGEFEWTKPTIGMGVSGPATCTAVIELRSTTDNQVLARANLAAGDTINCNVSDFPDFSYTLAAGEVEFPADKAPTKEDVIAIMNQEQKQNAAIKVIGAALVGGIGGNMAGKSAPNSDKMFGTNKEKITTTLIGAAGGAAVGLGGTYGGKVAGDMIMSTGINAAAGAVIGNMAATGEDVLRIEVCTLDGDVRSTCLWGNIQQTEKVNTDTTLYVNLANPNEVVACTKTNSIEVCQSGRFTNMVLDDENLDNSINKYEKDNTTKKSFEAILAEVKQKETGKKYTLNNQGKMVLEGGYIEGEKRYLKLSSAERVTKLIPAMIINVKDDKTFGYKQADWNKDFLGKTKEDIVGRGTDGQQTVLTLPDDFKMENFKPMTRGADDGGIIDISNKARTKSTLIGAGAGGALGAFTAYQGAQNDIDTRWTAATREYKDSMKMFYCGTGTKFLSFYNEPVFVPTSPTE